MAKHKQNVMTVGYSWKIPSRENKQLPWEKVIQRSQVCRFRKGREDKEFVAWLLPWERKTWSPIILPFGVPPYPGIPPL